MKMLVLVWESVTKKQSSIAFQKTTDQIISKGELLMTMMTLSKHLQKKSKCLRGQKLDLAPDFTSDNSLNPLGTGSKLNVHKTFRRSPRRLLNILCTFNLRPVSTGSIDNGLVYIESLKTDDEIIDDVTMNGDADDDDGCSGDSNEANQNISECRVDTLMTCTMFEYEQGDEIYRLTSKIGALLKRAWSIRKRQQSIEQYFKS